MKYFSNLQMKRILNDMQKVITDPLQRETASDFYRYFCKVNRLSTTEEES